MKAKLIIIRLFIRLFISLFVYSFCSYSVFAITTTLNPSKLTSRSSTFKASLNCTVSAKFANESYETENFIFKGASFSERHVNWNFDIETSDGSVCPEGTSFKLSIRGAEVGKRENGSDFYIYPVHIAPPQKGRRYTLLLRKQSVKDPRTQRQYTEWLPSDVDDAIQEK